MVNITLWIFICREHNRYARLSKKNIAREVNSIISLWHANNQAATRRRAPVISWSISTATWPCCKYSRKEALQVLWTATILHPQRFADVDMIKEVQYCYRKFYDYKLSVAEAERLLAGDGPLP